MPTRRSPRPRSRRPSRPWARRFTSDPPRRRQRWLGLPRRARGGQGQDLRRRDGAPQRCGPRRSGVQASPRATPLIPLLRRWLRRGPLNEPFEPYARALNDHWIRKRPVFFYLRGSDGLFHLACSAEGFGPLERRRSLEEVALATCRGRVLNVGAGAGRQSLLLREAGLEVAPIELAPT